jgi:hypothetical protein
VERVVAREVAREVDMGAQAGKKEEETFPSCPRFWEYSLKGPNVTSERLET